MDGLDLCAHFLLLLEMEDGIQDQESRKIISSSFFHPYHMIMCLINDLFRDRIANVFSSKMLTYLGWRMSIDGEG